MVKTIEERLEKELRHQVGGDFFEGNLGFQKMPTGYALMCTGSHYYWLRYDGLESVINWDKWAAYRGAVKDAANSK